jgi:hypothetical protein
MRLRRRSLRRCLCITAVVTIMNPSKDYSDFKAKLDQIHPSYGQTLSMDFGDMEEDEGKGL